MGVRRHRRSWLLICMSSRRPGRLLLACAIVALVGHEPSAQQRQKTVLTLFSTRMGAPGTSGLNHTIEETLGRGLAGRLDYHVEFLDLARFPEPGYQLAVRDFLRSKYDHYRFDLIVATTSASLEFVSRYRDELFPGTPLVFSSAPGTSGVDEATGVTSELNFSDTLQIASTIQPGVRRVFVVCGASAFDKYYETLARSQFKVFEGRLDVTYLSGLPVPELLRRVARLPSDSIIYFLSVMEDGNGDKFVGVDALNMIAPVANAPIYSWHSITMDAGIVGGSLLSVDVMGGRLAELGLRVLNGETADAIPVEAFNPNVVEFDWRQLRRWGIDEGRLPPGSVVRFRQPGIWELYRRYMIGGALVLLVQTTLIAGLLVQAQRRRRVERDLRESQNRYALATASGAVGVWDWNLDSNEIYVDPQLKQLLGYRDEEIRNHLDDWRARVHPDDRTALEARTLDCIEGRHDAFELELRMLHRNGGLRWFVSRGSILKRADGTPCRMVGTDTNITERKYAQQEVRDNELALQASSDEIQNLAGRLIVAQEAERTRIARDLHDDVSQQLAGFSIALSNLKRQISRREPDEAEGDVQGALTSLQQRTIALAENIRYLSHDLHPGVLRHAGLVSALTSHCAELQQHQAVGLTFSADDEVEPIDPEVALCLFRVAQEALRNVITHAGARHAEVRLVRTDDRVELTIADDGKGFDAAGDSSRGHGLGLVSINERVRLAGGTVFIESGTNSGTIMSVRIPMTRQTKTSARPEAPASRETHAT